MKTKAPSSNFRGRFEFLEATENHWRQPLDALLSLHPKLPEFGLTPPARLSDLPSVAGTGEFQEAIWSWTEQHNIRDGWIRDAAVQTVIANANEARTGWAYVPPEMDAREFALTIGLWIPPVAGLHGQPWATFKRTALKYFLTKLERYRKDTALLWGANQPAMTIHAQWAALWQKGKSPEQIRIWNERTYKRDITLANIQTRVHEFAKAIGLTLREGKSGRTRRI